jgi:ribonuclease E
MPDSSTGHPRSGPPGTERPGDPGPQVPTDAPTQVGPGEPGPAGPRPEERPLATGGPAPPAPPAPGRRPRIGDTRPAPPPPRPPVASNGAVDAVRADPPPTPSGTLTGASQANPPGGTSTANPPGVTGTATPPSAEAAEAVAGVAAPAAGAQAGEDDTAQRRGRGRRRGSRSRSRASGRYLVCVHVQHQVTQIAMLEGRSLVEHYVSRPANDTVQIDGNIYRGRVQNVLPGMEAAFVDIGIPKNAVLYHGDVRYDRDDVEQDAGQSRPRIEDVLRPGQTILCQVTKNPIGAKGARLTQEVSLPGRFAVLVPNSSAFGISKRLGDNERRRLRRIIDDVRPDGHGLIVRTAAEGVSADELARDVSTLMEQWRGIEAEAGRGTAPGLLYREPDLAVRILREELNSEYRAVVIDDYDLYEDVRGYVERVSPELADRVEYHDPDDEPLPLFERYHVHEQLHKALDRKVWLPSGGSLIIERTEALTVIDVNTGKNVGSTNLEETVFRNNLEAAEEVARQLRLRDIGGIIVIDFIDMEVADNRTKVASALKTALARDKTRTQVFDISELGLVEMTRKRVSEGLIESVSTVCEVCSGRGIIIDESVL